MPQNDLFPQGINAVVFILYKPVGNGIAEKVFSSLTYEKVDLCENIDFQNSIMETENKE